MKTRKQFIATGMIFSLLVEIGLICTGVTGIITSIEAATGLGLTASIFWLAVVHGHYQYFSDPKEYYLYVLMQKKREEDDKYYEDKTKQILNK